MADLDNIVYDIEQGSCVLIVGPDLNGGESFFASLCNELNANPEYSQGLDLSPQQIFLHEELLQLKNEKHETSVLRGIRRFYKKQTQLNKPFKDISQIPFHLIISLIPDTRLKQVFEEQNLPYQYHYQPRSRPPLPVEKPTKETPLIYNILGDIEDQIVITFDNLFTYLWNIMNPKGLPDAIQETLRKASTFIFLGIHFEKWYMQLLLKIITSGSENKEIRDNKEKYTLLKNASENDVCTFVANRLDLKFINTEPLGFLDQLYEECGRKNLLKTVHPQWKAKVFISYSHKDIAIIEVIESRLAAAGIQVIRDIGSMHAGQKISDFIETVKKVDFVLSVLSEHSLFSTWVSKEIVATLRNTFTYYLPCNIDDAVSDQQLVTKASALVKEKTDEIGKRISSRGDGDIRDLMYERDAWIEFRDNMSFIVETLRSRKVESFKTADFDANLQKTITFIINHSQNVGRKSTH